MKNIKQYTNLSSGDNITTESRDISINTPTGNKIFNIKQKIIKITNKIIKLGYCSGDGLLQCPIGIDTIRENFKQIKIGKTGMLEYQEELINGELADLEDFQTGEKFFQFPYQLISVDNETLPSEKQIYFTQTFDYTIEVN